ncbi:MAG: 6-bladed beta-propeller [Bacteroidales bacterium]|nr:6-bladed beta-propeller [Bacteroidales bacterium]MDD4670642.1 6-bladed beta-propeller [Bacteroidales bacterium]
MSFNETNSSKAFCNVVSSIELIPLETDADHLIGAQPEMIVSSGDFYLIDNINCRIFRYDNTGKFLNAVGEKGKRPGEYNNIKNVQIENGEMLVYSSPNITINKYSLEGTFLSKNIIEQSSIQDRVVDGGVLAYCGYGAVNPYRLFLTTEDNRITKFLDTEAKVLNFTEITPIFSANGNHIFIRESYGNTVYEYNSADKKVEPYLTFDFGRYSIGKVFFEYDDAFSAAEYLMNQEFAMIIRYMENDNVKLMEAVLNKKSGPEFAYGIFTAKSGRWEWFSVGKVGESPFADSFRTITDDALYCIIDPTSINNFSDAEKKLICNPEIMNTLKDNRNYVIAKITFK